MDLKKAHLYLYTFCRYFLATMIISYAFAKIFETQFTSQPNIYDKPIGSLSGFQLTWYYYGYSYWYGLVIAVTQIISSILLFFRKTTRIGIILFLTFMVNILLMDFAYDIQGAKGMALTLTLMALFVLLSDYKALLKYFVQEPPLFQDSDRPMRMNKISKIKFIYIPLVFIGFFVLIYTLKNKYMGKNEFYGTWENVETAERLHFEAANTFQINKRNELENFVNGNYTFTKDSLTLIGSKTTSEKAENYLKGSYKLIENNLIITVKNNTLKFKRIR
ncbi:hypothetical protein ABH942_002067 [Flavobacterium sp. 28YEA47A]|uniref:hypothetical protein n=1 Tax=Flavobacterium sp. 28YEA47A TaxID=3156276 RepID=UPI0035122F61